MLFSWGCPMDTWSRKPRLFAFSVAFLLACALITSAGAQGVPAGAGLDLAPTNPFGMPGTTAGLPQGSNSLYLNSGMFSDVLPRISNLEIGYLYQFGNRINTGRLSLDYVLPANVSGDQAFFGEAHAEFTNFWKTISSIWRRVETSPPAFTTITTTRSGFNERTDLSIGGGYRKLLSPSLMLGVNGFYDTTRLGSRWYGSGGLGFEMAALGAGNDLIELIFNYYGDIFQGRNGIINAFRNGPGNFDVSARYSVELGEYGADLRLKATAYQFDIGTKRYGWNTEAEVRTRNGMFSAKAGTGHDPVNGWYHTVGGFVNVGLDFSNLLNGESPFGMPEPIFRSPRNLRRLLTQKVDRNYMSPPSTKTLSRKEACGPCTGYAIYGPRQITTGVPIDTSPTLFGAVVPLNATMTWCNIAKDATINPWIANGTVGLYYQQLHVRAGAGSAPIFSTGVLVLTSSVGFAPVPPSDPILIGDRGYICFEFD